MRRVENDYLTMVSVTDRMLQANEADWKNSKPATRQIAAIRTGYAGLKAAQQGTTTETTGITEDTETAVQDAMDEAVILSKAVRSYALSEENQALHNQFKVSKSTLREYPNIELVNYLKDLLKRMREIGQPLVDFDVTEAELTAFETLIDNADARKTNTRTAINERKSHNQTIPQKMKALRKAFSILDNLFGSWVKTKPDFVRDYFNARQVIDTGGRGGGKNDKPEGGDEPQA